MSEPGPGDEGFDGGMGMSRRQSIPNHDVTEPSRDVEAVTETLTAVGKGDIVKVGMAINHPSKGRTGGTSKMKVMATETDVADFDHRVSLLHHDGDVVRLYMTGIGNDGLDAWEIVSCPYDHVTGMADMTDFAFHGWVVGAEAERDE